MSRLGGCAVLTTLLATATLASAQEQKLSPLASSLAVGSHVRLTSSGWDGRLQGSVVAIDPDTVTLATKDHHRFKVPLDSISSMDVGTGRKRNTLRGLGIGLAAGALLGLAVPPDDCRWGGLCFTRKDSVIAAGGTGALTGAMIGALTTSERWSHVRIEGRRVALAFRF
jgi:preprotein translocase subunit YajC